jgi:hypothetical protein
MRPLLSHSRNDVVVLAPARTTLPDIFRNKIQDLKHHDYLLAEMQRFRGKIYSSDGAIKASDLTEDGRHRMAVDERSWHVLSLDSDQRVCACLRYLDETEAESFDNLWIRNSALSRIAELGSRFRRVIETQVQAARRNHLGFGEVGGWAVAEEHRHTLEPVRIILATYALLRLLGDALGVATATIRHHSAAILRRIGLNALTECGEELPPYFDPQYGCLMEALQFDSRHPAPKYEAWVSKLVETLRAAPVIWRGQPMPL